MSSGAPTPDAYRSELDEATWSVPLSAYPDTDNRRPLAKAQRTS